MSSAIDLTGTGNNLQFLVTNRSASTASSTASGGVNLIRRQSGFIARALFADPLLQPLADNGGPTQTYMPGTGSPVIDFGSNAAGYVDAFMQQINWGPAVGLYERYAKES